MNNNAVITTDEHCTIYLSGDHRDFIVFRSGMARTIELFDIQVGSSRREGKGKQLVQAMLDILKEKESDVSMVYAIVRLSNAIAHQFYEALDFRLVGRLHYFYRDGGGKNEHALVYGLDV